MAKKNQMPTIKWREKAPKVAASDLDGFGFPAKFHYRDFLHRWNGGTPSSNWFKVKNWNDEETVARVEYFHGLYDNWTDPRDLRFNLYHTRDDLPRGAIPIATVDTEEDEWDLCTLLTFTWTDRYNKIYWLANPHDCGPYDPDDLSCLQLVANSLPQFLKLLKPYDHFFYRTWFQLAVAPAELANVGAALTKNGVVDWKDEFPKIDQTGSATAYNSSPDFVISLAYPNSKLGEIKPPVKPAKEFSILAIDSYRWNRADAVKHVRKLLKPLKLDRKLKRLGETPAK